MERKRSREKSADPLESRDRHDDSSSPSASEFLQQALRRSSTLTENELLGALSLISVARAEVERAEVGLLFAARSDGLTWAQIAEAMGFRSPQACQQYVHRLTARQDKRA